MAIYTAFWLTGKAEILSGSSVADAFNKAGYGAGALRALDFYSTGDKRDEWEWNGKDRNWLKKISNNA